MKQVFGAGVIVMLDLEPGGQEREAGAVGQALFRKAVAGAHRQAVAGADVHVDLRLRLDGVEVFDERVGLVALGMVEQDLQPVIAAPKWSNPGR